MKAVILIAALLPALLVAQENPLAGDPDSVPAGRKLFAQHCAECHGKDARGGKHAPALTGIEKPPDEIFRILTNGIIRRGMPSWSKLPEPQRWQIIAWLKSLDAIQ